MMRPHPWERSYPPGAHWDAPIARGTIGGLIDRAVARYAGQGAIEFRDRVTSYRALGNEVDRAAAAFLRAGWGVGEGIALYLPNTPAHPIAFFGAAKAGARVVHLSPLDAERVLMHKLGDSGARAMVTTNLPGQLPMALKLLEAGLLDRLVVIEDETFGATAEPPLPIPQRAGIVPFARFVEGVSPPEAWPRVAEEDIALLQYTGGTTGMPKGAMLSHGNLTAAVSQYRAWFEGSGLALPGQERAIGVLPLFHIYALTAVLLRHLDSGNLILLRQRFDVEGILADIETKRATSFAGVPTMWIALANHPGIETRDFSSLLSCSSGGAPMPVEVQRRFEGLTGLRLGGGWGMTETAPAGTNHPRHRPKPGSIGLPLPGVELEIVAVDEPTRVVPPGEVGELRVKGPNVFQGYWRQEDATRRAFVDGRFLTGDIGYMDEEGYFFLVERKGDMIISSGFNVYPQMIEQAIYEFPTVAEVVVVGVPDAYRGEAAKAYVTLRSGAAPFTLDELKAFLKTRVGRHEMPAALEFRDSLPRTPVGKLSRAALREEERRRQASLDATPKKELSA